MTHRNRQRYVVGATVGLVVAWLLALACHQQPEMAVSSRFERIEIDDIRVIDGDTIHVKGMAVRFLGVDSPERSAPWFVGNQEPWASRATEFTRQALVQARRIELVLIDESDVYGRQLGHVFVDGESLSLKLVRAGLGYETVSRFPQRGFRDLSRRILEAAKTVTPEFEDPAEWRRKNRKP